MIEAHLKKLRVRDEISTEEERAIRAMISEVREFPADRVVIRRGQELTESLLLLDGWREAYLPMLRFLESQLSPDALVVADDLDIAPQALAPYLDYVRKPGSGYVSVELPLGDRIELSLRA